MIKKTLKVLLIILVVLVAAAFAVPYLFKDKIVAKVKTEINRNILAKVDFKDIDISLFRHFPRVAVALEDLQVMGIAEFEKDTLISAKNIDVSLNLMSVISGPQMKIYGINLDNPRIHAIVSKDGSANWNIMKPDSLPAREDSAGSKPFSLNLREYKISNGFISYRDDQAGMTARITNLNHAGSGDFTSDVFMLKTNTTADAVSFNYANIPYLADAKVSIASDFQINNKTDRYDFETGDIVVNNLKLDTRGFFQIANDSTYTMDIAFKAPSTDFKDILSLIPVIYQNDFSKVKASGTANFDGFVKGSYNSKTMPSYALNLKIVNGLFQYSDLPKPVKNVNVVLSANNPDGITDHTVLDVSKAHLEMDNAPFDFAVLVKNPVSDMYIDGFAKGTLDLSKITQFVKLSNGTKLSGMVKADLSAKGRISAIEKQQYDQFYAEGTVAVNGLQYSSSGYPDGVKVNNLFMEFNPRDIKISDFDGAYKKTNFSANGTISDLLPYMLKNKTLHGNMQVKADNMNLNSWMGTSSDTSVHNTEASAPFAVPANLDLRVTALVNRLIYDKLEIQNLKGALTVADEKVLVDNVNGEALDGTMLINGSYSTKYDKKKPDITFNYDVKGLNVQKTFYAFNTVQKIMPIGQFLDGNLTSQLTVNGKLGDNMMPDLNSLTGEGNILLIQGLLKKFAPLEKLADLLNVGQLKEISLKDIKNHIEFTNGKVLVKPFDIKIKDIDMQIGGMHGFDQSLDYLIDLKVPRALMGDKGNSFVNNLVAQVNDKGVPLKLADVVNLQVKLGGTIKNPILKMDLKEMAQNTTDQLKQQALDFAKAKFDSTKVSFNDSLNSIKKSLTKNLEDELKKRLAGTRDSTTSKNNNIDSAKKKLENVGRGFLQDLLRKKKTAADTSKQ
ncbi:MAG: AsmA-like C-terminal region-containing protein [Chitinophagaceae bacterium]